MDKIEVFTERFKEMMKGHYPSEEIVNNLSVVLYKLVIDVLRECDDVDKEISNTECLHSMDGMIFDRCLKDISLFVSKNVLLETLNETYSRMRNIVPLNFNGEMTCKDTDNYGKINRDMYGYGNSCNENKGFVKKRLGYDSNSADFDMMDLDSIPKVDTSALREEIEASKEEAVRKRTAKSKNRSQMGIQKSREDYKEETSKGNEDEDDFVTDASVFTSGSYSSVPKVSIDLDY